MKKQVTLNCGTRVRVEGVIMGRPYGGMLEGIPTREQNTKILESAKKSFAKRWGQRTTHLIDPPRRAPKVAGYDSLPDRIKNHYKDPECLPEVQVSVWLSCFTPKNKENDGSEVVLIFYIEMEDFLTRPLAELLQAQPFIWADVAGDFCV